MFLKQSILSDAEGNGEGLKIVYNDVAPYAKEHSRPQVISPGLRPKNGLRPGETLRPRATVTKREFPDLKRDDLVYPGYSLCLPRFALLNGEYVNFPGNAIDYGYMSEEISDAGGVFSHVDGGEGLKPKTGLKPGTFLFPSHGGIKKTNDPELTILFSKKFTSVGLLLTFNMTSGDYCSRLKVSWFSGIQLLSNMEFKPDSDRYFCNNYVLLYDKIVITFLETSRPYRPVFVTRIDYGLYRDFLGDEILETSCLQEIDAISESVSINTLGFTARTKSSIPFDFQKKQKLNLYFNGKIIGSFYLKNGARKSKTDYKMDSHDAIGVLDGNEFYGGVYSGQAAGDVIDQIFNGENLNYLLDDTLKDIPLTGYIPYTTKRNALAQIAFAVGGIVDTSNYDGVLIYPLQTAVSGAFSPDDCYDGVTMEHGDVVTGVRLTVHTWQKSDVDESEELYKGELNGVAEVTFSDPHHDLSITGGEITRSGENFAVIGAAGNVVLKGKKYIHSTTLITKENKDVAFNKNIKEVPNSTLINPSNAQDVLNRVYAHYQKAESVMGDVLLGDKTLGQMVEIDTGYDGKRRGILESIHHQFSYREIKAEVKIHE